MALGLTVTTPMTFIPGPLAPANCSIAATTTTVTADGASTTTLTVLARDMYNNPIVTTVSLAGSGGNNVFGTASSTTDASGQFVTTLASTQVQTETITATLGGTVNPNLTLSFVVGPATSAQSSLAISPSSQIADNTSVITATLTLKDAQAHPISGATPTFGATGTSTTISAAAATNASGQSTVTYKTPLAQSENANVTVSGFTLTQPMTFVAGPPTAAASTFTASPTSLLADGATTTTLTVTARDAQNNLVNGTSVSLAGSGGNNTFGATSGTTNTSGVWSTTLKSTQVQTETITATINSNVSKTTSVTFTVGAANAAMSSLAVSPASQTADNASVITATLTLKDALAHPISGVTPSFTASGSATTISASAATDVNGQNSVTYKTGAAQSENALVSAGGINLSTAMSFVAGAPTQAASTFTISPSTLLADGSAQATLTVTARDAQGNPVNAKTVSLAGSGGNNTFAATSGTTNTSGVWSTTLKSTQVQTETITATINSNVTETASVTFTVGPASSTTSSFAVSPSSVVANNSATITATLTLKDAQAHPIAGVTPTFGASGSSTTLSTASATNASGQSAVTYKSTLVQTENATVSAGGLNYASSISFTPGPASATYSAITFNPTTLVADGNARTTVSVHLADAYNNVIPSQRVGFFSSGGAGPFLSTGISTDASGNAANKLISLARGSSKIIVNAAGVALTSTLTSTAPAVYCTGNPNYVNGQFGTATAPWAITTGDWNGDGRIDFAYADNSNKMVVYTDSGGFGFAAGATYTVCATPQILQNADMNGDGFLDLVVTCSGSSSVQVYYGTGAATFPTSANFGTGFGTYGLTLNDFDGDGRMDIAVGGIFGNGVVVYINTGGMTMSNSSSPSTGVYPRGLASGDFNGDGMADLVATNSNDGTVSIILATGAGAFANQVTYAVGGSPYGVAVGDFDNNNKLDIAVVNQTSNTVSVLLGSGTGTFGTQTQYNTGSGPQNLVVSDFNGDAYQDLLVANTGTNTYSMLKGNGTGTFAAQVARFAGTNPQSVATGLFGNTANVYMDFLFASPPDTKYLQAQYSACN